MVFKFTNLAPVYIWIKSPKNKEKRNVYNDDTCVTVCGKSKQSINEKVGWGERERGC